ncbi:MAG: polyprenyl diphosphate synthase [Candidatus Micrarchaeota archaeon]
MRKLDYLAIIPDGNRRFAKKHALTTTNGYAQGFKKTEEVIKWIGETEAKKATFWALSLDNLTKRSSLELKILFKLMENKLKQTLKTHELVENGIKTTFFGKTQLLPTSTRELINKIAEKTQDGTQLELSIALAYNGREEIVNAANKIAEEYKKGTIKKVDEEAFQKYLYYEHSPDLVIRTGDSPRLSGLMPWQTIYSELYFSKKLWPEFNKQEFNNAVNFFYETDSRKGK